MSLLARVAECTVPECVYNRGSRCYAVAITVGNGEVAECLTFHATNNRVQRREVTAAVGACKVPRCDHHRDYACTAERIYVGYAEDHIVCLARRME